jgi:phenylacetate-CoA ligase
MRALRILSEFLSLRKEQWLSPEEIQEIQTKKLSQVLSWASETEFYSGISTSDPLHSLPLTKKSDIQDSLPAFIRKGTDMKSLNEMRTSGSTGEPLQVYEGHACSDYGIALVHMNLAETGLSPRDLLAEISHKKNKKPGLMQSLGLFRRNMLSIHDGEAKNFSRLCDLKPDVLGYYPSVVSLMAKMNFEKKQIKLKSVLCGAEPLSASARKTISESFSCPVFNMYGTTEFGPIGWECPEEHSMHVNATSAYVEIVDSNGRPKKSGEGRLAITTLRNDAMPLLRYDIGDCASWGKECSCGRGLPVLKSLKGRTDDVIVLPSGKVRSALSVNLMDDLLYLRAFQIIQESPGLFVFRYVPMESDITDMQKMEIDERLRRGCLGEEISVEFEQVQELKRPKSGKLSIVMSKVDK